MALAVVGLGAAALALRPRSLPPPPLAPPRLVAPRPVHAPPAMLDSTASIDSAASSRQTERPVAAQPARDAGVAAGDARPRVAIVIDDLGDSLESARAVLALEPPVTVAVIPFRPDSRVVAAAAVERGREVILHLPLEPERADDMRAGSGFLRTGMKIAGLERQLDADLGAVPYIVGVNGHMGSRFTSDPAAMEALLAALRARGLFFLDSRTSRDSVAAVTATRLRVPFAERTLFLDHDQRPAAIARALEELTAIARRRGEAIAIGHPHAATIAALDRWLRAAPRHGISIVPASALVH